MKNSCRAPYGSDFFIFSLFLEPLGSKNTLLSLFEKNINILTMNTRTSKQGLATLQTTFEIRSREELNRVIDKIRGIESVIDIERTTG